MPCVSLAHIIGARWLPPQILRGPLCVVTQFSVLQACRWCSVSSLLTFLPPELGTPIDGSARVVWGVPGRLSMGTCCFFVLLWWRILWKH